MKISTMLMLGASALCAMASAGTAHAGATLDAITKNGLVTCGVHTGNPGFATADSAGNWAGFDVDYCRALAAAVFGDASKVKYVPTSGQTRLTALQSGEIDVLARNTTWTFTRDTSLNLLWAGVNFYDGQAFITVKKPGLESVKQLDGATVCVDSGSTTEKNLADYFKARGLKYTAVVFDQPEASHQAFLNGRCNVYTNDFTSLASFLTTEVTDKEGYQILPELISKEPLGPAVRRGDDDWFAIARWTLNVMIEAEEDGVTSENIDSLKASSDDPAVLRITGAGDDLGKFLGLDQNWSYNVIKQVGNYGEVFDRNLGSKSSFNLARGRNALWSEGGILYAPPLR
ncbi:amino acid ABC transporter substrate-binding protein [Mesorhizobium sp. KR1-2]|uniref:amino acid ABC transporter substrate-binding protein n=1 Tax=Mesorhizobium sp. KR1-2 TaxID=3156609 RepID=UPI0032B559A7